MKHWKRFIWYVFVLGFQCWAKCIEWWHIKVLTLYSISVTVMLTECGVLLWGHYCYFNSLQHKQDTELSIVHTHIFCLHIVLYPYYGSLLPPLEHKSYITCIYCVWERTKKRNVFTESERQVLQLMRSVL